MRRIRHRLALIVTWGLLLVCVVDWAPARAAQVNHPPPSTSTSPPVDMTVRGDSLMVAGDITCTQPQTAEQEEHRPIAHPDRGAQLTAGDDAFDLLG